MVVVHVSDKTPRISRKRAARSEQILEIAERLIAESGVESFSLHGVARELDVVTGTLYRYFPSKDALVSALHRRTIEDLHQRFQAFSARLTPALEQHAAELGDSERLLASLLGASRFYLDLPEQLPGRFRFVWLMLGDPRSLIHAEDIPKSAAPLLAFLGEVQALFEASRRVGALAAGHDLDRTLVFWAAHQGVIQLQKLERYQAQMFDHRRLGRTLARSLLLGWGAAPAELERAEHALGTLLDAA